MRTLPADRIPRVAAARRAAVSPPTITNWIRAGLIDGWQVGGRIYVSASQIDRVLATPVSA